MVSRYMVVWWLTRAELIVEPSEVGIYRGDTRRHGRTDIVEYLIISLGCEAIARRALDIDYFIIALSDESERQRTRAGCEIRLLVKFGELTQWKCIRL